MRLVIIGFACGILVTILGLVVIHPMLVFRQTIPVPPPVELPAISQQQADRLFYRLPPTVFSDVKFPKGVLEQDELLRRSVPPFKITTTFYNSAFQEVQQADNPGRYGAVVRIKFDGGIETRRFITLYRLPFSFGWRWPKFPLTTQLPSELANPAVLKTQQSDIGETIKKDFLGSIWINSDLAILLAGLSETSPQDPPAVARTSVSARDADWWDELRQRIGLNWSYPYLADLPAGYEADPNKKWPLILFLHGLGECGTDLQQVRSQGLAKLMGAGKQLPAFVISPQCPLPPRGWWETRTLVHFLDEISVKYRVDPDRIYVTGLSMGGFGTWSLALSIPDKLAAVAPICGGGDPPDAARLVHLPVWAFHGQQDSTVPVAMTTDMIAAIRKAGGHPHITIYPDLNHNSWTRAYDTEALYTWLLAQKRGQPEVKVPGIPTP